jgi:hypothetical protein
MGDAPHAEALRLLAGEFASFLFAAGIVGTGLPRAEARGFHAILSAATILGVVIDLAGVDSIEMPLWSAVVYDVISVPIMAVMMLLAV